MNGQVRSRAPGGYFIDLWGDDPYERGKTHGELLQEEIASITGKLPVFIRAVAKGKLRAALKFYPPQWLVNLTGWYLRRLFDKIAQQFSRDFPDEIKREMAGIAAGAKQSLKDILLINTFDDIHSAAIACSGVAIREKNKSFIYGYNLDYFSFTQEMAQLLTIFRVKTSKCNYFSVGIPGYVGILRGMNNHGLVIGYLTSSASGNKITGTPTGIRLRLALAQNKNIVEATCYLSAYPAPQGINILLGDAEKAIVLESAPSQSAVIDCRPRTFVDALAITNHFHNPEMIKLQTDPPPLPGMGTPLELRGLAFSKKRLDILEEQLENTPSGKLADCLKMLRSVCHQFTVSTCMFNPAEQELILINNNGQTPSALGAPTSYRLNEIHPSVPHSCEN